MCFVPLPPPTKKRLTRGSTRSTRSSEYSTPPSRPAKSSTYYSRPSTSETYSSSHHGYHPTSFTVRTFSYRVPRPANTIQYRVATPSDTTTSKISPSMTTTSQSKPVTKEPGKPLTIPTKKGPVQVIGWDDEDHLIMAQRKEEPEATELFNVDIPSTSIPYYIPESTGTFSLHNFKVAPGRAMYYKEKSAFQLPEDTFIMTLDLKTTVDELYAEDFYPKDLYGGIEYPLPTTVRDRILPSAEKAARTAYHDRIASLRSSTPTPSYEETVEE